MDLERPNLRQFYIGGGWVDPAEGAGSTKVVNPSDKTFFAAVMAGTAAEVGRAARAGSEALPGSAETPLPEERHIHERTFEQHERRSGDLAEAISLEMGAPKVVTLRNQVGSGARHLQRMIETLDSYSFGDALARLEIKGIIGHGGGTDGS
jgi:aldehyde dehydrogenase (NAD+)